MVNGAKYRAALRNLMVLATGTVLAQALTVLASPLLTRLYSPKDFGLVAVFFAIPSTILAIATLQTLRVAFG